MTNSNYLHFWIETKRNPNALDNDFIPPMKEFFQLFFQHTAIVENEIDYLGISHPIVKFLDIPEKNIINFANVITKTNLFNVYFYEALIKEPNPYNEFIKDVPSSIKNRLKIQLENLVVYHIRTNINNILREFFENFNKIGPFVFLGVYFEEVSDGYIAFFNDQFDLDFFFRDRRKLDSTEKWYKKHNFTFPTDFFEKQIGWVLEELKKIPPFDVENLSSG